MCSDHRKSEHKHAHIHTEIISCNPKSQGEKALKVAKGANKLRIHHCWLAKGANKLRIHHCWLYASEFCSKLSFVQLTILD